MVLIVSKAISVNTTKYSEYHKIYFGGKVFDGTHCQQGNFSEYHKIYFWGKVFYGTHCQQGNFSEYLKIYFWGKVFYGTHCQQGNFSEYHKIFFWGQSILIVNKAISVNTTKYIFGAKYSMVLIVSKAMSVNTTKYVLGQSKKNIPPTLPGQLSTVSMLCNNPQDKPGLPSKVPNDQESFSLD